MPSLTNQQVKNAKPGPKDVKLFDGGGLFLLVKSNGAKWWRFKYRYGGKERGISLGTYPEIPLADVRDRHAEARALLRDGIDPSDHRKAAKTLQVESVQNTFEAVAGEWLDKSYGKKNAPETVTTTRRRMELHLFPTIGRRPIAAITTADILATLQPLVKDDTRDTLKRGRNHISQVFRYAIATGRVKNDPSPLARDAFPPVKEQHHAAITEPEELGKLLRAIDACPARKDTINAFRLMALLFPRPGELRTAKWDDFDLDAKVDKKSGAGPVWNLKLSKGGGELTTPLPRQAVAILREMNERNSGYSPYLFPNAWSPQKPMSENALSFALKDMGYQRKHSAHGFRATARTMLEERLGFQFAFIEHQLGHRVSDPLGRAYNRTKHLEQRRKMLQQWADYLDGLRNDTDKVIPLRRAQ